MTASIAAPDWFAYAILIFVAGQRLAELVIARRNTAALLARGAAEIGAAHYPLIVALHAIWLAALAAWALVMAPPVNLPLLAVFACLQAARLWVLWSLGPFWTTRIITLPGAPLVRRGPYRFVRHPNYLVVILEIAVLPLVFGAWVLAAIFSLLNAAILCVRIRAEDQALAVRR
ncbi:MAG: isoprenylcysteine carboxyl methyltransferase family protein [Rhodospirillaceae bacterium]